MLWIVIFGFVDMFNLFILIYLMLMNIIWYVYELFVQNDVEDGFFMKGLVDFWEFIDGGQIWIFIFQDDLVWLDGEFIILVDVKYMYDQMMIVFVFGIVNGNLVFNFDMVEMLDDKIVVIILKMLQVLNFGLEILIVLKYIWEDVDDFMIFMNDFDVVGFGLFVFDSYLVNQFIVFKVNENFWCGVFKIDVIQYVYYMNFDVQVQVFKVGDVDFVIGFMLMQFEVFEGVEGIMMYFGEGCCYYLISINVGQQICDNVFYGIGNVVLKEFEVCQVICFGIDIEMLFDKVFIGEGVFVISFIFVLFFKWYLFDDDVVIVGFDFEVVQIMFDDVGWVFGVDGICEKVGQWFVLWLFIDVDDLNEQFIVDFFVFWMKEIGIEIMVEFMDFDMISVKVIFGDYDLYFSGWLVNLDLDYQFGINICMNLLIVIDGIGGIMQDGYCNLEFDEMYVQQCFEIDEEKCQEIVYDMFVLNYIDIVQVVIWYVNLFEVYCFDCFIGFIFQFKDGGIIVNQVGYWGYFIVEFVEGVIVGGIGMNIGFIIGGIVVGVVFIGGLVFFLI